MKKSVLFICTGNYYRSRFAEAVFNHLAQERELRWEAFSRGLATHLAPEDQLLSEHTRKRLETLQIPLHLTAERGIPLRLEDLERADVIIAMQHSEHRPMLTEQFPDWVEKTTFWEVPDVGFMSPRFALPSIEIEIRKLLVEIEEKFDVVIPYK